ncbi:MAG TPA: ABC transporter permease [Flavobacteriales bacterium]|nr:ABC transporter permease [Flavobacteriales bacterium]HOZ41309.1 ABC transporter permease [Flavobacteriales bacterium]
MGRHPVNFAHFIARRILFDKDRRDRLSRPIVGIAVGGIVVGMAVMILTLGITQGFQREVRAKVTGAGGHLQIGALVQTDPKETPRVVMDQPFYPWLDTVPGITHIQVHATKPGIIETDRDIEGVIVKGVGQDHDWSFLQQHLKEGELPAIGDTTRPIDMLLSKWMAARLAIGVDDTITVYLVKDRDEVRPRKFRVTGLYETGLEQLDHQLVYTDIAHIQRFAQWGLKAELFVGDSAVRWKKVEAMAFGGDRRYHYEWPGTDLHGKGPHAIEVVRDTTLTVIVSDGENTIPDTAWVRLVPNHSEVEVMRGGSGGSHTRYCGGFEVTIDRFDDLTAMDDVVYRDHLPMNLRSVSVRERFPEIFAWLELLDKNVVVVLLLMVIVAIINMTSALLIIILERTSMIGVLKALGSSDGGIRRIFLIDAAYMLGVGIVLGDLFGIALAVIQKKFGIIRLPVETYYVDVVAIDLQWWPILLLNVGTLVVCVAALILPSMLVTRIAPAKAIRFA